MVYRLGVYRESAANPGYIPDDWYHQLGISPTIRLSHFFVPETNQSKQLYDSINLPYVFIHRKASDAIINIVNWDIDEILTLDPDINSYPIGNRWYTLAQSFINQPFHYYYDTIRHAKEVHLVDSSFFCIAIHLNLDANIKLCYHRDGLVSKAYTELFRA
jgi:hypothetical protein